MICITGGSGEVASALATEFLSRKQPVKLYSRSKIKCFNGNKNFSFEQVVDYSKINFDEDICTLVVTNGSFLFKNFENLEITEILNLVESNFTSVTYIIRNYLKQTNIKNKRNIFVFGSTAAYDLGAATNVYSALKLAIKGLLIALNKEYENSDTRFSFISTSTINNKMGNLVPGQTKNTLLSPQELSSLLVDKILVEANYFEPEIVIRRRHIQRH